MATITTTTPASSSGAAATPIHTVAPDLAKSHIGLKTFCEGVKAWSSDSSFQAILNILEKNESLQKRNESLEERLKEQEKDANTAITRVLKQSQSETAKKEELLAKVKTLEEALKAKDGAINDRERKANDLAKNIDLLNTECKEAKAALDKANGEIQDLNLQIKKKDLKIDGYIADVSKANQAHDNLKDQVEALKKDKDSIQAELQKEKKKISKLKQLAAPLNNNNDDGNLQESLSSLWKFAKEELYSQVKKDLPELALQSDDREINDAWDKLSKVDGKEHKVPLVRSNSGEAKRMRLAVLLAILAREIDSQIFQPAYLSPGGDDFREMLVDLAVENQEKEAFCRAMLLSFDVEKQKANLRKRKRAVVEIIGSYVKPLLSLPEYENFRKSLEAIVARAAETWILFRYSRFTYDIDFYCEPRQSDSLPFDEDSTRTATVNGSGESERYLLTIFPCLGRVDNGKFIIQAPATALRESQCAAAQQEKLNQEPLSMASRRRARRQSVANPTFINASNDRGQSFLAETAPLGSSSGGQDGS